MRDKDYKEIWENKFDFLNPKQYTFTLLPADQLKQPAELERNGVEVSYPTQGELRYAQGDIATDSTEQ